jgi:lauroyl/myristoyl acyltransferase
MVKKGKLFITGLFTLLFLHFVKKLVIFPLWFRYCLTDLLSYLYYLFSTKKRFSVSKNLQLIMGRKPLKKEVYSVFAAYGRYWAELYDINSIWFKIEKVLDNPKFPPNERGYLGLTFHIGNFEFFGPALSPSLGENFYVVAERLEPQFLSNHFRNCRLQHSISTIYHDDIRQILKIINEGHSLGIVCDRLVGGKGIETRLFGKKVRIPLNIVSIALQKNIPVFVSYCVKNDHILKFYHHKLLSVNFDDAVLEISAILETAIRKHPFQWHVLTSL